MGQLRGQERAYKEYRVIGSPAAIGRQMATYHRGEDGPGLAELSPEQIDFARACGQEALRVHAPLFEELASWAQACSLPLDQALFYFSVGMTWTSRRGRSRRPADRAGESPRMDDAAANNREGFACSTVGLMTSDGPVIGRNFDLYHGVNVRHFIRAEPCGLLQHAGMYDGLVAGRTDGMNSEGLFVSVHTVRARPPQRRKPGLFSAHLARIILETCGTARQAAAFLQAAPHIASFNYFLADPHDMLVVECHPQRVRMREAEDGVLACTNHYADAGMVDLLYAVPRNSASRLEFLSRSARRLRDRACCLTSRSKDPCCGDGLSEPQRAIRLLLADHSVPVCGHTANMTTLWSAVAEPRRKTVTYCFGAPCENELTHTASWE